MHIFKNEPYFKDMSGYIAPLSEWLDMIRESREMYRGAYEQEPEEYIGSLIPVAKVNGEWQEFDR